MERCRSGRTGHPAKVLCLPGHRGFESLPLRPGSAEARKSEGGLFYRLFEFLFEWFYSLATASPITFLAPFCFKARAASFIVAPVVTTSSTKITIFLSRRPPFQAKEFFIFLCLASFLSWVWGFLYFILFSCSLRVMFRPAARSEAINFDWLNPRQFSLRQCKGMGIINTFWFLIKTPSSKW